MFANFPMLLQKLNTLNEKLKYIPNENVNRKTRQMTQTKGR